MASRTGDRTVYLTQLLFVHEGKEEVFHQFEDVAIPLMAEHHGRVLYRLRPGADAYVTSSEERPDEIHFMSFDSEADFEAFINDDRRLEFLSLKEKSVRSTLLVKGVAI